MSVSEDSRSHDKKEAEDKVVQGQKTERVGREIIRKPSEGLRVQCGKESDRGGSLPQVYILLLQKFIPQMTYILT